MNIKERLEIQKTENMTIANMNNSNKTKKIFEQVTHEVQMQSLQDVFSFEEVEEFVDKVTEEFVTTKIAEAQLGGGTGNGSNGVDLSSYATKAEVAEGYQPKGNYLTEHQKLKTINGVSLVGEGNIEISGSGGGTSVQQAYVFVKYLENTGTQYIDTGISVPFTVDATLQGVKDTGGSSVVFTVGGNTNAGGWFGFASEKWMLGGGSVFSNKYSEKKKLNIQE